jgi:acetyl-CoA C-acetyltransferase
MYPTKNLEEGDMKGIKDKCAIVGAGCCKFGERWESSFNDLIVEAVYEAYEDAGVGPKDIEAAWIGFTTSSRTGESLARPLKLDHIPITHVENACATAMETVRNACFAVACGEYDMVLAVGAEKLKDSGLRGLPWPGGTGYWQPVIDYAISPPAGYAYLATRYFSKYNISPEEGKRALAKIAVKNHHNGSLCPKAHFQFEISLERVLNAPLIAWPLGLFDCCPTTDGAAAAIITRTDLAPKYRSDYVLVKGVGEAIGPGFGRFDDEFDYCHLEEAERATRSAYEEAGIKDARKELDLAEIHDAFTIAELLEYEALGFCPKGGAIKEVANGSFTFEGDLPVNVDGGLKAFGHPIGASGLRIVYEIYKQLQGKAQLPQRQLKNPKLGLGFNEGGLAGAFQPITIILGLP